MWPTIYDAFMLLRMESDVQGRMEFGEILLQLATEVTYVTPTAANEQCCRTAGMAVKFRQNVEKIFCVRIIFHKTNYHSAVGVCNGS